MTQEKEKDILAQALEQLRNCPIPSGPSEELLQTTLNRLATMPPRTNPQSKTGRIRFMKNTFKFAAAAVILIAVLIGINQFGGSIDGASVVWADVVQRVQQAKAFTYRMEMTMSGEPMPGTAPGSSPMTMDGVVWISADYGMKVEMNMNGKPGSITYLLPEQKKIISVMPEMKKYMEMEYTDDLMGKIKQQNQDPREWVQRMVNSKYQSLGKSVIDGIEVEGLESTDPAMAGGVTEKALARLWVDTKAGYPVQIEMEMDINEGKTHVHSIIRDFQWNQDVDASLFTPEIDSEYTALPKMEMPKMDSEAAVNGLRKYSELTGRYPKNLNLADLMTNLQKNKKLRGSFDPNQMKGLSEDKQIQKAMELMMPFQSLGMFYMTLVQEKKDPAYYGKTVMPGDANSVLLQWKASDTTYKVIMGDLSVTEMSLEQLKQIEPQPDPLPTTP